MRTLITLLISVITFASVAVAQSKKDKIEIGVQSTSLTVFPPDTSFDETKGVESVAGLLITSTGPLPQRLRSTSFLREPTFEPAPDLLVSTQRYHEKMQP